MRSQSGFRGGGVPALSLLTGITAAYHAEILITLGIIGTVVLYGVPVYASPSARPAGYPGAYCRVITDTTGSVDTLPAWTGGVPYPSDASTINRPGSSFTVPAGHSDCYFDTANEACTVVCIPSPIEATVTSWKDKLSELKQQAAAAQSKSELEAVSTAATAAQSQILGTMNPQIALHSGLIGTYSGADTFSTLVQTVQAALDEIAKQEQQAQTAISDVNSTVSTINERASVITSNTSYCSDANGASAYYIETVNMISAAKNRASEAVSYANASGDSGLQSAATTASTSADNTSTTVSNALSSCRKKKAAEDAISAVNTKVSTINERASVIANNTSYCSGFDMTYYLSTLNMVNEAKSMASDAVNKANASGDSGLQSAATTASTSADNTSTAVKNAWAACRNALAQAQAQAEAQAQAQAQAQVAIESVESKLETINKRASVIANNTSYCNDANGTSAYYIETLNLIKQARDMASEAVGYAANTGDDTTVVAAAALEASINAASAAVESARTDCREKLKQQLGGC